MLKNRFSINKTTVFMLLLIGGVMVVFLVNLVVLLPSLVDVFTPQPKLTGGSLINTQIVNQAIEHLQQ